MSTFKITTPHAAIKIWNYVDRMQASGASTRKKDANNISEEIVSTLTCSYIHTSKNKSDPVGGFNMVFAPTRNWTAAITPGSWCVVMMSNDPIEKKDLEKANPRLVKMIGRIDSVRTNVVVNSEGARTTQYLLTGKDWGQVFTNILYVDPLIPADTEPQNSQGNSLFLSLIPILEREGTPLITTTRNNLETLLRVMGRSIVYENQIERIGKNTHSLLIPDAMKKFLGLDSPRIMDAIQLLTGALKNKEGEYDQHVEDGMNFIDPYSLAGQHNLWQVMQDNANYALNEMYDEMSWKDGRLQLNLVNRIKPFAFRDTPLDPKVVGLRSLFKYVETHVLDPRTIRSVNAGTNWRDKFNFLEIKPEHSEYKIFDNLIKQKAQAWDKDGPEVFDREGFRPLIFSVKQLPFTEKEITDSPGSFTGTSQGFSTPELDTMMIERKTSNDGTQRVDIGYWQNKPFQITLNAISGADNGTVWVAEAAAKDTQLFFDEAKAAGLKWRVNDSFRTMEQQVALQSDPDAALPGRSPHQNGRGLDITMIDENGKLAPSTTLEGQSLLAKLEPIAYNRGWVRDVEGELWHFTYRNWRPDQSFIDEANAQHVVFNDNEVETIYGTPPNQSQAPATAPAKSTTWTADPAGLMTWNELLKEWYFDTHRLLNGEIVLTGSSEYIPVGDNIMFPADLLGVKANLNKGHAEADRSKQYFVLAHVESVDNIFQINGDARTFQTTINFVRGIVVDGNKTLVGDGVLDTLSTALTAEASANDQTMVVTPTEDDPDRK